MTFDFNKDAALLLEDREARNLLLAHGMPYYALAALLLVGGIVVMFFQLAIGIALAVLALLVAAFGARGLLLSGKKREDRLTSILVANRIKTEKDRGKIITKEDTVKIKFEYDPLYREKVMSKIRKNEDEAYERRINNCKVNLENLEDDRAEEIRKLTAARWEYVGGNAVLFNMTEGKIKVNGTLCLFSDIIGAELNKEDSYRKVAGKPTKDQPNPPSVKVPTCNHVGVLVNISGYQSEVELLKVTVDQTDKAYAKAMKDAKDIINKLRYLSTVPVPENYLPVEDEASVIAIDDQIIEAQRELDAAKANKPTYSIPERYLLDQ